MSPASTPLSAGSSTAPGCCTRGADANHTLQLRDTVVRLVLRGAQGMELRQGILDIRLYLAKALLECSELGPERSQRGQGGFGHGVGDKGCTRWGDRRKVRAGHGSEQRNRVGMGREWAVPSRIVVRVPMLWPRVHVGVQLSNVLCWQRVSRCQRQRWWGRLCRISARVRNSPYSWLGTTRGG